MKRQVRREETRREEKDGTLVIGVGRGGLGG